MPVFVNPKKKGEYAMLKGWKTYLVVVLGVIFNGLVASGYVDESLRSTVNSVLMFLGLGALRNSIPKS